MNGATIRAVKAVAGGTCPLTMTVCHQSPQAARKTTLCAETTCAARVDVEHSVGRTVGFRSALARISSARTEGDPRSWVPFMPSTVARIRLLGQHDRFERCRWQETESLGRCRSGWEVPK